MLAHQGTPLNVLQGLGRGQSRWLNVMLIYTASQLMQNSESISNVLNDTILIQSKLMKSTS